MRTAPREGHAVLLVHGFASSMHSFDLLTPFLAEKCRVIRVDLLGHGCTGGNGPLDPPSQARIVAAVLDEIGAADVTALGHSFGADVALAVAERSEETARLIQDFVG